MSEEDTVRFIAVRASTIAEEEVLASSSYYIEFKGNLIQATNEKKIGFFIFKEQIFENA